jgi:NTP pyrophosphatase (non-canonical NTP hydrolase)
MTVEELQQRVDDWIKLYGVRYFNELTNLALLTEEIGEVARIMARQFGEQSSKPDDFDKKLSDELADVIFVLVCIANQTGVDLTSAIELNFQKKSKRDAERHLKNDKLLKK